MNLQKKQLVFSRLNEVMFEEENIFKDCKVEEWEAKIIDEKDVLKEQGITLFSDKSIVCEHTKTAEGYVGACVKCIEKVRNKKVFKQFL